MFHSRGVINNIISQLYDVRVTSSCYTAFIHKWAQIDRSSNSGNRRYFHRSYCIGKSFKISNAETRNMAAVENNGEIILKSAFKPIEIPSLPSNSVVDYLLEKAKENVSIGRTKWMTNAITGETMTYTDFESMTRKVASFMHKRGMKSGDIALYLTSDVTRIFAIIPGIWRLGGCAYSSYPEDTEDTLLMRIEESKARWIFCDPGSVAQCLSAAKRVNWYVEIIVFGNEDGCTTVDNVFQDDGKACPDTIKSTLDDPLLILCTSGTTGRSKGAIYTHRSILAFCLETDGVARHNPRPALWLIKCTHVLGVLYPMRNIAVGDWSIMMHQITKNNIFKAIDTYHPFLAFGFPTYLLLLATDPEAKKYDLTSLECICTGGIVITSHFYNTMRSLPHVKCVFNGYGMTECGAITTTMDISGTTKYLREYLNVPPLTVGKLYPNNMLKVLDLETGKTVGAGVKGELCVKSPILCSDYWKRPEESANTFKDGWMRTGDVGYYDENGFVFVVDRVKETFKYFNNHISPAEIEDIILKHPAVAEVSVFGIQDPDGGDHIPRAVIVVKSGFQVTPKEIVSFVEGQVASYKRIRGGVFIVDALPRGKTGKVMRSLVAALPLQ